MPIEQTDDRYTYWANKPAEEMASEVIERVKMYYSAIDSNGILDLWQRIYCTYYGLDLNAMSHAGSEIRFGGEIGEVVEARLGHLRSIVQYLLVTTTAHPLNYTPRAVNTDYSSKAQVYAAKSLLDYYEREKRLGRKHKSVALRALLYGIGFLWLNWDPNKGREFTADTDENGNPTGKMLHEGDIVARPLSPIDVVRDISRPVDEQQWYAVRCPENRYDLAARYLDPERPELSQAIIDSENIGQSGAPHLFERGFGGDGERDDKAPGPDDIEVWHFYHARTEAVPEGRYIVVIGDDLWLYDGPLPYQDVPIYHMMPDEFLETSWGYTTAWDLISNDELYDGLISSIWTAVDAFLIPNVFIPQGSEIGLEEIAGGLNLIKYPVGHDKPEVARMVDIPKSAIDLLDFLQGNAEARSGVNSVARGQLDSNITSGTMAALVHAQAAHFNSGLEQSYIMLIEDSGTALIRIFKSHAHVPRMIQIVGETGKGPMQEFVKEDISDIDRVIVDAGNPLERTVAGKESMARLLIEKGLIKDPAYYFEVLGTGRLESLYRPDQIAIDSISRENELLGSGKVRIIAQKSLANTGEEMEREIVENVPVLATDNHWLHIPRHADEANSPEVRTNAELLRAILTHIRDHIWQVQFGDKMIPQLLGHAPAQPPGGPGAGGGGGQQSPMPELTRPPNVPLEGAVDLPGAPDVPENPMAGQVPG